MRYIKTGGHPNPGFRLAGAALLLCMPILSIADDLMAQREQALAVITPKLVNGHVQFLSHDLLEGRDTGKRGYAIAREYVASQFVRMGAEAMPDGTHLQAFEVLVGGEDRGSRLTVGGVTIEGEDASFMPDWTAREPVVTGEGVYVGQGLVAGDRDDYGSVDVGNRIVFMIPGAPPEWKEHPTLGLVERTKIQVALARGARAVVMLRPDSTEAPGPARPMALANGGTPAELLSILVFKGLNQATAWSDSVTSIPSLNFTPVMTCARYSNPR